MASEGTSLEDIESGAVAHTADDAVMNAILSDMNAVEEPQHQQVPVYTPPPPPPPPPMQQMQYPPMDMGPAFYAPPSPSFAQQYQQPPVSQQQATYEPVEAPVNALGSGMGGLKKNSWSTLFDQLRDPLVVGLLVCLFSLPALHTALSKRMSWAYQVGGSLSWIGFLLLFVLVSGIFATYRQIMTVTGL